MNALLLALAMQPVVAPSAGRYEMGVRLIQLDQAWLKNPDVAKRAEAVNEISGAVADFFQGRTTEVCRRLDRATEILGGSPVGPVSIRPSRPVKDPSQPVEVLITWAYSAEPVSVSVGDQKFNLSGGESRGLQIPSGKWQGRSSLKSIRWTVDAFKGEIQVSELADFSSRVSRLEASKDPMVQGLLRGIQEAAKPGYEVTLPIGQMLEQAEGLASGKLKPGDLREVHAAVFDGVPLRARLPRRAADKKPPVVIALHGAGGSENMFFDSLGAGLAPRLAEERGWIFVSPRSLRNAVSASLTWLKTVAGVEPGPVLVMGHSMGGGLALQSGSLKPAALALFAPAAGALPADQKETPIFLSVGAQEMSLLKRQSDQLAKQLPPKSESKVYPRCEHLMIVAEALPDVFRFFDRVIASK